MIDETYTRQQARQDKRAIFGALRALGNADTGPADNLSKGLNRRDFTVSVATATAIPVLPTFSESGRHVVEATGAVYRTDGRPLDDVPGGGDWFHARGERAAYARAQAAGDSIGMTVAAAAIRAAEVYPAYRRAKAAGDQAGKERALSVVRRAEWEGK